MKTFCSKDSLIKQFSLSFKIIVFQSVPRTMVNKSKAEEVQGKKQARFLPHQRLGRTIGPVPPTPQTHKPFCKNMHLGLPSAHIVKQADSFTMSRR